MEQIKHWNLFDLLPVELQSQRNQSIFVCYKRLHLPIREFPAASQRITVLADLLSSNITVLADFLSSNITVLVVRFIVFVADYLLQVVVLSN